MAFCHPLLIQQSAGIFIMNFKNLKIEKQEHIGIVFFDRPKKANALNHEHLKEIELAAKEFSDDVKTRVVIFTGSGNHFSSGADLTDPGTAYDVPLVQRRRRMRVGEKAIEAILNIDQITIAAWNGGAMGGGACIATACDFRIGTKESFMQYPEIDIGVNLMWKSLPLIINLVGPSRAKKLVVGGVRANADQLERWGIFDEMAETTDLMTKALEMASFYSQKPPIAAQMIKQSINKYSNALASAVMHMDVDQNILTAGSEDRKEAISAYLGKTKPTFKGN